MPRTTLDLDPTVLDELKRRGRAEQKSVGRVATELLAHALATPAAAVEPPFTWSVASLGTPLVDLDDKDAVARALGDA